MKTFTNCAEKKAKQFLNLLQGYTKGIRMTAILVLLLMGVSNAWGWNPVYLIGDPTNNWTNNKTSYVISNNQDAGSAYCYFSKNNSFAVYITYYNEQAGPSSNGAEMSSGTGDQKFFIWDNGANSHAAKYVGNNGIIEIHAQQKDNGDDQPWIWLTRPEIYIRHNWSGSGWSNEQMSDNQNGTYQYIGFYSGANSTNIGPCSNCADGSSTFKYFSSATLVGTPQKGQKCIFEYNASGYKGFGAQTSNTGSLTITRLYTITYNGNGHTGGTVPAAIDKKHGTSITLSSSTPTRTGYTFAGWNTKQDGTGTTYAKGAAYSTNADVTLYAKWTANTYTVTFNKQSGTGGTNSVTATYDEAMPSATMPTYTGYTFNGYFDATSGGTKYYNANGTSARTWNKTAATTLYARWTENKYNVDISTDGNGTTNQTGNKSIGIKGISITATPEIGSAFKQWEVTGGAKVANATSATTKITATAAGKVTAVFEEKPATTIYLEPTGHWNSDNPQYVAHVWNGSGDAKDIIMTGVGEAPYKYYKAEVPYGYTDVVFFRKKSDGSELWNQTGDLTIPTNNNTLYVITDNTTSPATGGWKDANLFYTVTLVRSEFGPYGIKYNGQSYFSKDGDDVIVNVPYGATINFIEGQPYSDIYTGDIMEKGVVRKFDLTQPYTVLRDVTFESNYVTKVEQVAYLGVPNGCDWDKNASYANFTWRFDSFNSGEGGFSMTNNQDKATFAFEVDDVTYYTFTIPAGCNKFQIQRKEPKSNDDEANENHTYSSTDDHKYMVLNTGINCYMLDNGTFNSNTHTGHWCALPADVGDYRLLYVEQVVEKSKKAGDEWKIVVTRKKAHPSDIIKKGTPSKTVSLHTYYKEGKYTARLGDGSTYKSSNNPEIILQKYLGNDQWEDIECQMVYGPLETLPIMANLPGRKNASSNSNIDDLQYQDGIENIKKDLMPNGEPHPDQGNGVWNFVVTQNAGKASVQWNQTHRYTGEYYIRTDNAEGGWDQYTLNDNYMTYSQYAKDHSGFSHYFCRWVEKNITPNTKFVIANDHGVAISDTLSGDQFTDKDGNIQENANIRWSWNEATNEIARAYIQGAYDGKAQNENILLDYTTDGTTDANDVILFDTGDWIYSIDVTVKVGSTLKSITATYPKITHTIDSKTINPIIQTFEEGLPMLTGGESANTYTVRVLYDFKIDKTLVALVPNEHKAEIGIDVLMERIDQKPMTTQVQAGITSQKDEGEGSTVYGVMTFTKLHLTGQGTSEQEKLTYWISFPFDVRLSDIFGFGAVGKYWMIKFYDGASRAANGLYDDNTYWKFITNSKYVLKANQGYVLSLDKKVMDPNSTIYTNRDKISLYFPSKEKITDIDKDFTTTCNIPEHKCDIKSPTDRRIYDSNWNLIGVPSYGNHKKETNAKNVTYFYDYDHKSDSYTVAKNAETKTFQAMFAYMVQFAGTINWETFTFTENGAQGLAAKKANAAYNQHNLRLELQQSGSKLDHTFIQLQDEEATEMFDMNSDLCKIINAGSNIYSIITTESTPIQVAGNVMPIQETIIPLGIKLDAAGEYTFAMPDGTDGIVVELIDYETNTRTNMLLDNYTVNLGKGTFENRFALHVKPNKTTTSLEDVNTNTTGVKKYLIDGILYMQKDGVLYDAQGKLVR